MNQLEDATVTSPFKRPAWITNNNKEDGPYQVARTGLHVKQERIVLQVYRGAEATQDSTHAQGYNE